MTDAAVFTGRAQVRAGILVTGTEVLTGIISDRNGPWLSERLQEVGVDAAMIEVVGDRPEDLHHALSYMAAEGMSLIITSGGLGPTADDLTAEIVGSFSGREMVLDERLDALIQEILKPLMARFPQLDPESVRVANRKQAVIPQGATVLDPVGTAPGLIVPSGDGTGPTVVVLPGPPSELQPMWHSATSTAAFQDAIRGAVVTEREMIRMYGVPEAEISNTLRAADSAGISLQELEITTCLRRGELEVSTRFDPARRRDYARLREFLQERHGPQIFSADGSTIDQIIAAALLEQRLKIATAESCTGGLLAARLTELAGSSAYVAGGAVVYSNQAKSAVLGVAPDLIAQHGAVSTEVALALAEGARHAYGSEVGVGITGIAGPDGGSEEKPVGTVCFSVALGPANAPAVRTLTRSTRLPGERAAVRERSTTVAMHLIERVLRGEGDPAASLDA